MRQTYLVQVIYGQAFEDLYIEARSAQEAITLAKKQTSLPTRWARFAV